MYIYFGPDRAPTPSGSERAPIAPSGPNRAPIAPSGPDQGEIALSLVALLYKAASSATPAVRMVPGRSARILGGCGAVGDIARAYLDVDLEYPQECHDKHTDYPLAPEIMSVSADMLSDYQKKPTKHIILTMLQKMRKQTS